MIVNFSVSKLREVLDLTSRFVSKHSTLPVLENIYIKGNIDTLLFRATDMEKYVEIELPAKLESEGSITVNAKTLTDIIKNIESDQVQLVVDENNDNLSIKTENDEFNINGIPANEYVAIPEVSDGNSINLYANSFSKGISKVEYAVTERNFSPVLTGVLLRLKNDDNSNKIIFTGTDTFRLAEYRMNFEGEFKDMSIIVPKININEIKKVSDYFIEAGGTDMGIVFSDNLVAFDFNLDDMKIRTTSILIQGNFPDYENESIIPSDFSTNVVADKSSFEKAIKKISILTRDINNFIDINIDESNMNITSGETDKGQAKTNVPATINGGSINFGINGKYILDFIKDINSSEVVMNIVDNEKPVVFKDKEDENYTYVVRPLVK